MLLQERSAQSKRKCCNYLRHVPDCLSVRGICRTSNLQVFCKMNRPNLFHMLSSGLWVSASKGIDRKIHPPMHKFHDALVVQLDRAAGRTLTGQESEFLQRIVQTQTGDPSRLVACLDVNSRDHVTCGRGRSSAVMMKSRERRVCGLAFVTSSKSCRPKNKKPVPARGPAW